MLLQLGIHDIDEWMYEDRRIHTKHKLMELARMAMESHFEMDFKNNVHLP
jgi:hypothetical protein